MAKGVLLLSLWIVTVLAQFPSGGGLPSGAGQSGSHGNPFGPLPPFPGSGSHNGFPCIPGGGGVPGGSGFFPGGGSQVPAEEATLKNGLHLTAKLGATKHPHRWKPHHRGSKSAASGSGFPPLPPLPPCPSHGGFPSGFPSHGGFPSGIPSHGGFPSGLPSGSHGGFPSGLPSRGGFPSGLPSHGGFPSAMSSHSAPHFPSNAVPSGSGFPSNTFPPPFHPHLPSGSMPLPGSGSLPQPN